MTEIDEAMDVQAAACFTGIAVATLAKMRCMGGGPLFVKLGRRVVYRRSDVIAWLNARRVRNTTEAAQSVPRRLTDALHKSSPLEKNSCGR
jgi:predicted DNA-binding transcriptional regulator AlpA